MPEPSVRRIGKYEIQAELGRGGFGRVYRAFDPSVGRAVAIKILTAEGNKDLLTRFRNEAAAAGNLRHKNIVTIYDFGDYNGLPYIVMEFLEGEDLQQVISSGRPLSLLDKVNVMAQVADGLECAHRNGVVHRDVKPGNIRLLPDGTVKLMDFGIARLVGDAVSTRLTRQGHVIGTLLYMAPEQVMGSDVDYLCDIFAYGSTYYEFLTGKHPFQAPDPRAVFFKITSEDPEPIRSLVPECPEALEQIIRRALHKDRELRYQSFRDIGFDTEPILIELRTEQSENKLQQARSTFQNGELESAQSLLSDALGLDPTNREARKLRETIQLQLMRRMLQPRIDALVAKGDNALTSRRLGEALESFETAFRLDRTNSDLQRRVDEVRALIERNKKVSALIADARANFAKQDPDSAIERLDQALALDPENGEALQFRQTVRQEIERRNREVQFQESVRAATDLFDREMLDQAEQILHAFDPDQAKREPVQDLAGRIQRRRRAKAGIEHARTLLSDSKFEEAVVSLERLNADLPGEGDIAPLLNDAREQLRARQKADALVKLDADVRANAARAEFDQALQLCGDALVRWPGEAAVVALRDEVTTARTAWLRENAIRDALQTADSLLTEKRFQEASNVIAAAIRSHGPDAGLSDGEARIRDAWERQKRADALASLQATARAHANTHEFTRALQTLAEGLREFGEERELLELQTSIREEKAVWDREQLIAQTSSRCEMLASANRYAESLEEVSHALLTYPDDPALVALHRSIEDRWESHKRTEAIRDAVSRSEKEIAGGLPERALDLLAEAIAKYPDDPDLVRSVAAARVALQSKLIAAICSEANYCLDNNDFEGAMRELDEGLSAYPGDSRLEDLRNAVTSAKEHWEREQAVLSALSRAEGLASEKLFDRALGVITECENSQGADARLANYRLRVVADWAEYKRKQTIARAIRDANGFISKGQPERAVELLQAVGAQYRARDELAELLSRAQSAAADQEIERLCAIAAENSNAAKFEQALEVLDGGLAKYPGHERLLNARNNSIAQRTQYFREQAIKKDLDQSEALAAQSRYSEAVQLLARCLEKQGDDPRLSERLHQYQALLEEQRKRAAIERLCREVRELLDASQYDRALGKLNEALGTYGDDSALAALKKTALQERAAWEENTAVNAAISECGALTRDKRFEEAEQTVRLLLNRYPKNPKLLDLLEDVKVEQQHFETEQAILKLLAEAEGMIQSGVPEDALTLLESAREQFPSEPRIGASLSRAAQAHKAKKIADACAEAGRLLDNQEFDAALDALSSALTEDPRDLGVSQLRNRILSDKAKWERRQAIQETRRRCESLAGSERFDEALGAIETSLRKFGRDEELVALQTRLKSQWEAHQRSDAIVRALRGADDLLARGQPGKALSLLEAAAGQYPDEAELQSSIARARQALADQRRAEAVESICRETRLYLEAGQFDRAEDVVEKGLGELGGQDTLARMRETVLEAKADWLRELQTRAIEEALRKAEERLRSGDPQTAIAVLEDALRNNPDNADLVAMLGRARETARAQAVESVLRETRLYLEKGQFDRAEDIVEKGLDKLGGQDTLTRMRETVLEAKADWLRELQTRAIEEALRKAEERLRSGDPQRAIAVLEDALRDNPDNTDVLQMLERAREAARAQAVESVLRETRLYLETKNFDAAEREVRNGLQAVGSAPELTGLRETVLSARADWMREEVLRKAEECLHRNDPDSATELLDKALRDDPENPELLQMLERAREAAKAHAVERVFRETRLYLETKDFDAAERELQNGLQAVGSDPGLTRLQETVLAARADWMREIQTRAIEEVLRKAEERLQRNDPDGATELLEKALRDNPDNADLLQMLERAREAAKAQAVERVFRETRLYLETKDFDAAEREVQIGLQSVGSDPGLTRLHQTVLNAKADWQAEWDMEEARRRKEALEGVCRRTRLLIDSHEFDLAEELLEEAIRTYSKDENLTRLQETLLVAKTEFAESMRRSSPHAQTTQAVTDEFPLPQIADLPPAPPERPPSPPGRTPVTPSGPRPRSSRVLYYVGGGVLAVLGTVGFLLTHSQQNSKAPRLGRLELLSDPSGANVRLNGKSCTTPDCSFDLPPGQYTVEFQKDGFETKFETATVGLPGKTSRLEIKLEPVTAPPAAPSHEASEGSAATASTGTLVIETGKEPATLLLDGKVAGNLNASGALRLQVEPKTYTVRVDKPGYESQPDSLRIEIKAGGQVSARFRLQPKNAELMLTGLPPGTNVAIDSRPVGTVGSDTALTSGNIPPGEHSIQLTRVGFSPVTVKRVFAPGGRVAIGTHDVLFAAIPQPKENSNPPRIEPPVIKPDPVALEAQEWQTVKDSKSASDLEAFLRKHPAGAHRQDASNRIEQLDWDATAKNDRAALERFAAKYKDGQFHQRARDEIVRIDREAADVQQKQLAEKLARAEKAAVLDVLKKYSEAYRDKDPSRVRALWPAISRDSMKTIEEVFRNFRSVTVEFRPLGDPEITGNTAQVRCRRWSESVDRNGPHSAESLVTVRLVKKTDHWVIDSLQ